MDEQENKDMQQTEPVEKMPYSDISDITSGEADDRLKFADELKELAADIIAGRVKTVAIFKYVYDDPHSLIAYGFMESQGAQKHMYQDIAEACENALDAGAFAYMIGGEEDDA